MRRRRATVATPDEWQCKTGGVQRLFKCFLLLLFIYFAKRQPQKYNTDKHKYTREKYNII